MKKVVAIIGMGLSGNAAFCRLIQRLSEYHDDNDEIEILIFEKSPQYFATGFAYAKDSPKYWTLNNPAAGFKFVANTETLTQWMQEQLPGYEDKPYVPRFVVGRYLVSQYEKHAHLASKSGIQVKVIHSPVQSINQMEKERYQIVTPDGTFESDGLFLTPGHLQSSHFSSIEALPGYLPFEQLMHSDSVEVSSLKDIYVIGGQAAFVDTALWLTLGRNFAGTIHCVTRNPGILTTKGNPDTCETDAQQALANLLKERPRNSVSYAEARNLFWSAYQTDAKSPLSPEHMPGIQESLTYQMKKFDHDEPPSQTGNIDELRDFIKTFYFNGCYSALWNALDEIGKSEFLKYFYSLMMAYLTGITPINARLMLELYQNNKIVEHHGVVGIQFEEESNGFVISLATGEKLTTPLIIDATGYRYSPNAEAKSSMLIDALAKSGLISPKAHGGLQLTDNYQLIDACGNIRHNAFCLGPVADYNHEVPTPHSSFMVGKSVESAITALIKQWHLQSTPSCVE